MDEELLRLLESDSDADEGGGAATLDALRLAMDDGDVAMLQQLLQGGVQADTRGRQGSTPLCEAAAAGNAEQVSVLLGAGAEVDLRSDGDGATPLFHAAKAGSAQVVALLLEQGADANVATSSGATPLHAAAAAGAEEAVQALLAKGARVDARNDDQETPLHLAAHAGHAAIIRLLLEQGADVNAKGDERMSPLHYAVREAHQEAVAALLERQPDLGARAGATGGTPLHFAAGYAGGAIAQVLLDAGAGLDAEDEEGDTPIQ